MLKDKEIGFILYKVAMLTKNDFSNRLNVIGITSGQFAVLKVIYWHQKNTNDLGLSPCAIATSVECDRPTTSGIINRLESQGWIERFNNPDDKRSYLIRVTDKAVNKLEELEYIYSESCNTMLKGFTEEESTTFKNYLLRVEDNLKK